MNAILRIALGALAIHGVLPAEVPKKAPLSKYTTLWTNSPFTSKPPPPPPPDQTEILADYSLAGVSPIQGGYRVTLLDKKNPEKRIFVFSDDANAKHGFKVLGVTRKPGDSRGTVVRISTGNQVGSVTYDDKLMTIAQPPPQQPAQAQPQVPGMPPQPQVPAGQVPQRQPRPRVVPPPTPPQIPGQPQIQQQIEQQQLQQQMQQQLQQQQLQQQQIQQHQQPQRIDRRNRR